MADWRGLSTDLISAPRGLAFRAASGITAGLLLMSAET